MLLNLLRNLNCAWSRRPESNRRPTHYECEDTVFSQVTETPPNCTFQLSFSTFNNVTEHHGTLRNITQLERTTAPNGTKILPYIKQNLFKFTCSKIHKQSFICENLGGQ
jgi:hypothetical protein